MPEKSRADRIEDMYRSGTTSASEIAKQLGSDPQYVRKVLRDRGLRGQKGNTAPETGRGEPPREKQTEGATDDRAGRGNNPPDPNQEDNPPDLEEVDVEGGRSDKGGTRTRTGTADKWGAWYKVYIPHETMAKINYLMDDGKVPEDMTLSDWIIEATDVTMARKYKLQVVVEDIVEKGKEEQDHYKERLKELLKNGEITTEAYFKALGEEAGKGGQQ